MSQSLLTLAAFVALTLLACEAVLRHSRRRRSAEATHDLAGTPPPSDADLTRWLPVLDRILRAGD